MTKVTKIKEEIWRTTEPQRVIDKRYNYQIKLIKITYQIYRKSSLSRFRGEAGERPSVKKVPGVPGIKRTLICFELLNSATLYLLCVTQCN